MGIAVTRIRTWVTAATTQGTNQYTITAIFPLCWKMQKNPLRTKMQSKEMNKVAEKIMNLLAILDGLLLSS